MKNILKSIVVFLAFIVNAQAQQDTIPRIDTTLVTNTENARSVSRNGNYINMDLPGINLDGADFSPLDDTIRKLNDAGWDVKIVGYYGLSGTMDDNVYADLFQQITVDKQVVVKINFAEKVKISIELYDELEDKVKLGIIKNIIQNELDDKVTSLEKGKIIQTIAKALAMLNSPILDFIDVGDDGFGNRVAANELPKVKLIEDGFYLTAFGVPIWLPKNAIVSFWPNRSAAVTKINGVNTEIAGTNHLSRGMLAYVKIDNDSYWSCHKIEDGKIIHYLSNKNKTYFAGFRDKNAAVTLDKPLNVILGLTSPNCEIQFVSVKNIVSHVPVNEKYVGGYLSITELKFEGYHSKLFDETGKLVETLVLNKEPYNLEPDCPFKLKAIDFILNLNPNCVKIDKTIDPNGYVYIFDLKNEGKVVYQDSKQKWFKVTETGIVEFDLTSTSVLHTRYIDDLINRAYNDDFLYQSAKVAVIVVASIYLGPILATQLGAAGLGTFGARWVAGFAIDALYEGAVYLVEENKKTLMSGLILSAGIGVIAEAAPLITKIMKGDGAYDNLLTSEYKASREALEAAEQVSLKGSGDVVFKVADDGVDSWIHWTSMKEYLEKELKLSKAEINEFIDDFPELLKGNKLGKVIKCIKTNRYGCGYPLCKAWSLIKEYKQIRKDFETLNSLTNLIAAIPPGEIDEIPIGTILDNLRKAGVKCKTCDSGDLLNKQLHEVIDDFTHAYTTYGKNSLSHVISDMAKSSSFAEGAIFVLDVIKKNPDLFPKGKTFFEYTTNLGRIDVLVREGDEILFEFKNVANVLIDKMGDQFFRDLDKAKSLANINWFFNGRKLGNIKEFTESQKIEMIGDITSTLLSKKSEKIEEICEKMQITPLTVNALVSEINANFEAIFKIIN